MKVFKSLSVILFCCSTSTYAAEYEFAAVDNTIETKICIAAVTDIASQQTSEGEGTIVVLVRSY